MSLRFPDTRPTFVRHWQRLTGCLDAIMQSILARRRGYKWAQLARNRGSRARELKMLRIIALESQGRGVKRSQAPIRAFLQGFERMRIVTPHMSVSG
jgi:hypothetical protein